MTPAEARAEILKALGRKPRKPKYSNVKTEVDGILFDSKKEAQRYVTLKLLERIGDIEDLVLQPRFLIADAVVLDGRKQRARYYIADFQYVDAATGKTVVEDVKGMKTAAYRAKRHQVMLVHGIEVKEV